MKTQLTWIFYIIFSLFSVYIQAQNISVKGTIHDAKGEPLPFVNLVLKDKNIGSTSDTEGVFEFPKLGAGKYILMIRQLSVGFQKYEQSFTLKNTDKTLIINVKLEPSDEQLNEVVITGTMKEVRRSESPAPIEVYNSKFFLKNPTPNLFESLTSVNGVRPQLQCSVCNTGDIHINGMEGPYTMVMIDGMPIVSGLSTVYGLLGIPSSMIDRLEVVKGPASTLYGSEAVGWIDKCYH